MPVAEFEEREYECAAAVELSFGGAQVWSPGQVAEKILGFDGVAAPYSANPVWTVLQVPRPPGLRLLPVHWPQQARPSARQLPGFLVSLVLQYKRPTYLYGSRAAQWRQWRRPYYRFERTARQHRVLVRLENALGKQAVVRYAAPAFWRRGDLEQAHLGRTVLTRSGFVSPTALGRHRVWTYVDPGVAGRGNPTGRDVPFATLDQLYSEVFAPLPGRAQEVVLAGSPLERHLRALGEAARYREPRLRDLVATWVARIRQQGLDLDEGRLGQLADLATIVTLMTEIGATWCLVSREFLT